MQFMSGVWNSQKICCNAHLKQHSHIQEVQESINPKNEVNKKKRKKKYYYFIHPVQGSINSHLHFNLRERKVT